MARAAKRDPAQTLEECLDRVVEQLMTDKFANKVVSEILGHLQGRIRARYEALDIPRDHLPDVMRDETFEAKFHLTGKPFIPYDIQYGPLEGHTRDFWRNTANDVALLTLLASDSDPRAMDSVIDAMAQRRVSPVSAFIYSNSIWPGNMRAIEILSSGMFGMRMAGRAQFSHLHHQVRQIDQFQPRDITRGVSEGGFKPLPRELLLEQARLELLNSQLEIAGKYLEFDEDRVVSPKRSPRSRTAQSGSKAFEGTSDRRQHLRIWNEFIGSVVRVQTAAPPALASNPPQQLVSELPWETVNQSILPDEAPNLSDLGGRIIQRIESGRVGSKQTRFRPARLNVLAIVARELQRRSVDVSMHLVSGLPKAEMMEGEPDDQFDDWLMLVIGDQAIGNVVAVHPEVDERAVYVYRPEFDPSNSTSVMEVFGQSRKAVRERHNARDMRWSSAIRPEQRGMSKPELKADMISRENFVMAAKVLILLNEKLHPTLYGSKKFPRESTYEHLARELQERYPEYVTESSADHVSTPAVASGQRKRASRALDNAPRQLEVSADVEPVVKTAEKGSTCFDNSWAGSVRL